MSGDIPYWLQADTTLRAEWILRKRYALRHHSLVEAPLLAFWEAAMHSLRHSASDDEAGTSEITKLPSSEYVLTREGFDSIFFKIYLVVLPEFDAKEASTELARDWQGHTTGSPYLTRVRFQDAVFQVADLWTNSSVDPQIYASFLWTLLKRVASRNAGCRCPGNCSIRVGGGGFNGTVRGVDGMIPGQHSDARRAAHSKRSQYHHGRRGSAISIGGSLLNIIASDERALLPCFSFKPDATLSYSSDYDGQESDEEPTKLNDGHELTAAVESASGDRRYRRRTNSSEIRKSAVMISVQTSEKAAAAAAAAADVVEASELAADDNEASAALARAGAAALEAIEAAAAAVAARPVTRGKKKLLHFSALVIQTFVRGMLARHLRMKKRHAIVRIQANARAMEPRAEVQQRRWASAKIQTLGHFRLARNRVRRRKAAIVNIQRRMRGNIASRNFAWKLTCANAIQRATRAMLTELTDKAARGEFTERGIEQLQEEPEEQEELPKEAELPVQASLPSAAVEIPSAATIEQQQRPGATKLLYYPSWWGNADERTRELYVRAMCSAPASPRREIPAQTLPGFSQLRGLRAEHDETWEPPSKLPAFPNHAYSSGPAAAGQSLEAALLLSSAKRQVITPRRPQPPPFSTSRLYSTPSPRPSSAGGFSPKHTLSTTHEASPRRTTRPFSARAAAPARQVLPHPRLALIARPASARIRPQTLLDRDAASQPHAQRPAWVASLLT